MKKYVPSHLKHANRRIIYEWIKQNPSFSRAQITKSTQISGPTVQKVVQYFMDKKIVRPVVCEALGTVGRQPSMLKFAPDFAYSANLLYEGDYVTLGLVDMDGNISYVKRWKTERRGLEMLFERLPDDVGEAVDAAGLPVDKLCGVGIGIPGVMAPEGNGIRFAPLIGVHEPYDCEPAVLRIQERLNLPVVLENDVNAAAWGVYCSGHSRGGDLIYYSLGTGLGAGIVLKGHIRRGHTGQSGEFGYNCMDADFVTERSRSGWLEQRISLRVLRGRFGFTVDGLYERSKKASPELIDYVARHLGLSIANFHWVMDIGTVVLGGIVTRSLGLPLLDAVHTYTKRICLDVPDIVLDDMSDAGVVGLANLSSDKMLTNLLQEDDV